MIRPPPTSTLFPYTPLSLSHARRSGHVDVHVVLVGGIFHHGVRVRPPAGLDIPDVLRVGDVGDVEDPDAAEPVRADRVVHPLRAAIEPAGHALTRYEEQVLVDGDVAL